MKRYHYYDAYPGGGWVFQWDTKLFSGERWVMTPTIDDGRQAVFTHKDGKQQVFEIHFQSTKYHEGWVAVEITGYMISDKEKMGSGAPIGAFTRELDASPARDFDPPCSLRPRETYDSKTDTYLTEDYRYL